MCVCVDVETFVFFYVFKVEEVKEKEQMEKGGKDTKVNSVKG